MENVYHLEVWFGGRVQGVGFRYTVLSIAKGYDVCGYVKNLPDGRVHLIAEGDENEAKSFLDHIQNDMASFIKEMDVKASEMARTANDFRIVYWIIYYENISKRISV